jgi:hypothetical protein
MEEMVDAFVKELELREAHNAVGTTAMVNMVNSIIERTLILLLHSWRMKRKNVLSA